MHCFPTKEHLLLGVLQRRDQRDEERFLALAKEGLGLLELLVEIMRGNVAEPELATLYAVLMAEGIDPSHRAHQWFVARNQRVRAQLGEGSLEHSRMGRSGATWIRTRSPRKS